MVVAVSLTAALSVVLLAGLVCLYIWVGRMSLIVAAVQQRFAEAGISTQEQISTSVNLPESWQQSDGLEDFEVKRPRIGWRDEWRDRE